MLYEKGIESVNVYLNDGRTIEFTNVLSVSEENNEYGALALIVEYYENEEKSELSKTTFVLTNDNVIFYKLTFKR